MKYSRNFSDENKEKFRVLNKLEMIKNICTLGNKANSDERTQNSPELEEIEHAVAQVIDNNFKQFNYCVFMRAYRRTNEIFKFIAQNDIGIGGDSEFKKGDMNSLHNLKSGFENILSDNKLELFQESTIRDIIQIDIIHVIEFECNKSK